MKRSKVNTKALFANLKIKRDAARTTKLAELDARIADAEVSALAVLDHYETTSELIRRCHFSMLHLTKGRCTREDGHMGPCLDNGVAHVDAYELFDLALLAYKRTNPRSRGERLWVFNKTPHSTWKKGDVECRFCRVKLIRGGSLTQDYTMWACSSLARTDAPTVSHHTRICALRYLAKVTPTPQLPPESFVLAHDEEEAHP